MLCVTTVSYSILLNVVPTSFIKPTWVLGKVIPFLFLLCTEGLHGLITQVVVRGDIHDFSLSRRSLRLTHLLFADDNLLFCRSTSVECQKVLDVLEVYEKGSRHQINKAKTNVFFSKSTSEDRR